MAMRTTFAARIRAASPPLVLCLLALAVQVGAAPVCAAVPPSLPPAPPVAAPKPFIVKSPAGDRVDNYYWLRDDTRTNPDVLAYLAAENAYKDAMLAPVRSLQDRIYGEIVGRIKQDDTSVPYQKNGWWYYRRYDEGGEYPIYARRQGSMQAPEQVMLDATELAHGRDFYQVGNMAVSPDGRLLAYADDTVGRRQYTLRFKDLATGKTLADTIENAEPSLAWTADNRSVLYIEKDPVTLLGLRVRQHLLGADPKSDRLVYEQNDPAFYTDVFNSKDERFVVIYAESTVSSEIRYADAADPKLAFRVFLARERDHEYQAKHLDGRWIIRTNWRAKNFRLMEAKVGEEDDRSAWRELLAGRDDAFINDFDVFRDFIAVDEHTNGLRKIRIRPLSGGEDRFIASGEPTYTFALGDNPGMDTEVVRYTYESLATPGSTYDYNTRTGEQILLKRDPVQGAFDPTDYVSEYIWATARDGTKVPVSLVYRRGFKPDGSAPLLQEGYGSYGISSDPDFSISRLSLLDRGFVFAIAHVRGGDEMGRDWYENGKLLNKKNTFNDFVDVTRFLVAKGYADPRTRLRHRRQRGRSADGRDSQRSAARLQGDRRRSALRRRRDDHARRDHPAHHQRVRRVGQPQAEAVLRLHAVLFTLRQRRPAGLSGHAGHDRPVGQPGPVLRARQVGGKAAGHEDGLEPAAVSRQHGSGAWGEIGPIPAIPGNSRGIRLHRRRGRHPRLGNSPLPLRERQAAACHCRRTALSAWDRSRHVNHVT